jgi:uncharacterized membrane protein YhaH (DUF805 family)
MGRLLSTVTSYRSPGGFSISDMIRFARSLNFDGSNTMATAHPSSPLFETFTSVLKNKYADFSGRARRAEFWNFALATVIVAFGVGVAAVALAAIATPLGYVGMAAYVIVALGTIIPSLASAVRRLHDTGKSGWYLLIGIIPVIGSIALLIFYFADSSPEPNQYGPSPKYS